MLNNGVLKFPTLADCACCGGEKSPKSEVVYPHFESWLSEQQWNNIKVPSIGSSQLFFLWGTGTLPRIQTTTVPSPITSIECWLLTYLVLFLSFGWSSRPSDSPWFEVAGAQARVMVSLNWFICWTELICFVGFSSSQCLWGEETYWPGGCVCEARENWFVTSFDKTDCRSRKFRQRLQRVSFILRLAVDEIDITRIRMRRLRLKSLTLTMQRTMLMISWRRLPFWRRWIVNMSPGSFSLKRSTDTGTLDHTSKARNYGLWWNTVVEQVVPIWWNRTLFPRGTLQLFFERFFWVWHISIQKAKSIVI